MKLTVNQRKEYLKSFLELDMQKELKILFEKMFSTSIYILQGANEFGKDLVIRKDEPTGERYISVVVKMGDISGSVRDTQLRTIRDQVEQSFSTDCYIDDKIGKVKINETYVFLFGNFSNNAQENIDTFIKRNYEGRVSTFDICKIEEYFLKYYPEIYHGASGLEALTKKDAELDLLLKKKDSLIEQSFIKPNIKKFSNNSNQDIDLSNISSETRFNKNVGNRLFGVEDSIEAISKEISGKRVKYLIEGEAGSGKSIFSIKLSQKLIEKSINSLETSRKKTKDQPIKVPILFDANKIINGKIDLENYYTDSTYDFLPSVFIIDGLDEVPRNRRDGLISKCMEESAKYNASIVFTCRKNYNLIDSLDNFEHFEIKEFEISQAINYVRKVITNNDTLVDSLVKGLEQIEHQIPLYPMALSLLIEIAKEHNEVPASISELYRKYINLSLGEKDSSKGIEVLFEYKIKKNFLTELSYELFFKTNSIIINYTDFKDFIGIYVKDHPHISSSENFIEELKRSSLLKFENGSVAFLHKSFLDFFVAEYYLLNRDELEEISKFTEIYEYYYDDYWQDVLLFFFGIQTKITKTTLKKLIDIGYSKKDKENVNIFMLGRLMQYAWDSKSDAKQLVINNAVKEIVGIKSDILSIIDKKYSKKVPTIASDIATLQFFDLSYSSLFLVREIENFVSKEFSRLMQLDIINTKEDERIIYFSCIFIISSHKIINLGFLDKFFNDFLKLEKKIERKEIIVPLVGLFSILLKKDEFKNKINEDTHEEILKDHKHLMKKFRQTFIETFLVKSRNEPPHYRKINIKKVNKLQ